MNRWRLPGGTFGVMRRFTVPKIGGMVLSTLLTLIVIPVLFAMIHGRRLRQG